MEALIESLTTIGCEKVCSEQTNSVAVSEALRVSVEFSLDGDTIVATGLDQLALSVRHLGELLVELKGNRRA